MTLNDVDHVAEAILYAAEQYFWADLQETERDIYRRMAEAAIKALCQNLTRVDLVLPGDSRDRREYWADSWEISVQDEGRTLKLFATGEGTQHRAARDAALGAELFKWLAEG